MKPCHICGEIKPQTSFYKTKSKYHKDGLINWCKSCILMYHQMKKDEQNKSKYKELPLSVEKFMIIFD